MKKVYIVIRNTTNLDIEELVEDFGPGALLGPAFTTVEEAHELVTKEPHLYNGIHVIDIAK